jgi:mono/diheme cytochrome c family protein
MRARPLCRVAVARVALAACGVFGASGACGAREAPEAPAARGAYLAKLMGCPACHSPDPARPYAGGLEGREAAGPWRASNVTPHAATGIGRWTDAQIAAAIRDGVRPDGRALHPIMPYRYYRRLTDEDARALVAFLRALAPIEHAVDPVPGPHAHAPLAHAPLAPPPAPPSPTAASPAPADRGEYLVALMHCAACHATPGPDGQPDPARPLAGGKAMQPFGAGLVSLGTGTLIASNITPDRETGIGAWTADDIARAIKLLVRPDGTVLRGPMQLYAAGWSAITNRDASAIAAYLKQLPPVRHRVPAATFQPHGAPSQH